MKWMTLIFVLLFSHLSPAQPFTFWDNLTDSAKALHFASPATSASIEAFYFGEKAAGDSTTSDALMATLSKADSSQLPFYFKVFCQAMPVYRDSLPANNFVVHTMNMLSYHPAYVLQYLVTYDDQSCEQLFSEAIDKAFTEMEWFFPAKATFRKELSSDLSQAQKKQLNQLLE